jgi:hypothetical protein
VITDTNFSEVVQKLILSKENKLNHLGLRLSMGSAHERCVTLFKASFKALFMEELQASILERQYTVDDAAQMLSFVRVLS